VRRAPLAADDVLGRLKALADPARLPGMARYGIEVSNAFGVSIPSLRAIARTTGRDHALALALWRTGVHEARILARSRRGFGRSASGTAS
jgi:3-methyladenine DNA glycosylase AlkD